MSSSSLATYRALVPGHAAVKDAQVELWLELAAARHTASRWGQMYASAMVFWAAAHLEVLRLKGEVGSAGKGTCAPANADASASKSPIPVVAEPYWGWYLDLQKSRAAGAPTRIAP